MTTTDTGTTMREHELQQRSSTPAPRPACTASRHGSRAAYVAGCRCTEARRANRNYAAYRKRRAAEAAFGAAPPFSVLVADTRSVVDQLRGTGWTLRRIAAETGIGRDHLQRIYGHTQRPLRRVRWATHRTLSGLLDREPVVAGHMLVDAYATWRRIHGLIALGYPKTWIAGQLDIGRALQLNAYRVTRRNAEKVRILADTYGGTPGPSDRARAYAAARGWTADLLWDADDDMLLMENEREFIAGKIGQEEFCHTFKTQVIDDIAIERHLDGDRTVRLTRAEKEHALRTLIERGVSRTQAGRQLSLSGSTVHTLLGASPGAQPTSLRGRDLSLASATTRGEAEQGRTPARPPTDTPAIPRRPAMPSMPSPAPDSFERLDAEAVS